MLGVPVFFLLMTKGKRQGTITLRNGLIIAGVGALLLQQIEVFLFSLTLIPLGYSLYQSGDRKESPAVSGGKGALVLGVTWVCFWVVYGIITEIHPYKQLLELLDIGFRQTYEIYKSNSEMSEESLYNLLQVIDEIRTFIPRILPGFLAASVVMTVWVNMIAGNALHAKITGKESTWNKYSSWALPDQLIWLPIGSSLLMLLAEGSVNNLGICGVIVSCLIYFFQGLAVFIHLLDRWKVPPFFRIVFYFILVLQTYGILILAVLGIGDTWLDFRKSKKQNDDENN